MIGTIIGAIPGVGASVSNLIAYGIAGQLSKTPETFGKGNPEGVIAPESANNATTGGSLLPTLSFGIPGGAEAAVLLGAFVLVGLTPGPGMLVEHLDVVWAIIFGLVLSNIFASTLGLFASNIISRIALVSVNYLIPVITVLCLLGAFAVRGNIWDVLMAIFFGFLGWGMKRTGFPIVGMVLGFVLGHIIEVAFHQSLMISDGSYMIFVARPISLALILCTILILMLPFIRKPRTRDRLGTSQS